MEGYLVLEDGTSFSGELDGHENCTGEAVFFTGMTGYQEVLTDPSYKGQIIVFTYPLIGNYGINEKDFESKKPQVKAAVVYEACDHFSHYEAVYSLKEYLQKWNIPLLTHVDTRAVVKKILETGRWVRQSQPLKKELRLPFNQRMWQSRLPPRKSAHSATGINISLSLILAIKSQSHHHLSNEAARLPWCHTSKWRPYTTSNPMALCYRTDLEIRKQSSHI